MDLVVGTPIAGRARRETENLIGFFANTLALRVDLSGDSAFSELLRRVRQVALEAYDHQDVPFEKLVQELAPDRSLSHHPLFQAAFAYEKTAGLRPALPGLEAYEIPLESRTAKFDLTLWVGDDDEGGLRAALEYDTDLFEEDTAGRLLEQFERVVTAALANPAKRVSELPLVSEEEERRILGEWNRTNRPYPRERCVHELFEEQARRTPMRWPLFSGMRK